VVIEVCYISLGGFTDPHSRVAMIRSTERYYLSSDIDSQNIDLIAANAINFLIFVMPHDMYMYSEE
jgi:hypothetical protein